MKGFRDIVAEEALQRDAMIKIIADTFEEGGFQRMYTPALEAKGTLYAYGDETSKQIYEFDDADGARVGLRYDLTVPFARYLSTTPNVRLPLKRYQIQQVWRYDKPDPGRFREFMQCDIDVAGSSSSLADAQIILVIMRALYALKLKNFQIRLGHRKIIEGIVRCFANVENVNGVIRIIDKFEKIGMEGVVQELGEGRKDESGAFIKGLGLSPRQVEDTAKAVKMLKLLSEGESFEGARASTLSSIRRLFPDEYMNNILPALNDLEVICQVLYSEKVSEDKVKIDVSLARGLGYYTGPIFECELSDAKKFGSICGGGRYDELIKLKDGTAVPAVGCSIGIDRLFAIMSSLGILPKESRRQIDVLICVLDQKYLQNYISISHALRRESITSEIYCEPSHAIGKQLKYADVMKFPYAIIAGENEFKDGMVQVKDLAAGKQESTSITDHDQWKNFRPGQATVKIMELPKWLKNALGRA